MGRGDLFPLTRFQKMRKVWHDHSNKLPLMLAWQAAEIPSTVINEVSYGQWESYLKVMRTKYIPSRRL